MKATKLGSQRPDPANTSGGVQGPSTEIVGVAARAKALTACDGNKCAPEMDTGNRGGVLARREADRGEVGQRGMNTMMVEYLWFLCHLKVPDRGHH